MADHPKRLWDDVLPVEVKELPEDLAALDALLADQEFLWPLVEHWRQGFRADRSGGVDGGGPTIPLETYVRLMLLKQRYRRGYSIACGSELRGLQGLTGVGGAETTGSMTSRGRLSARIARR